MYHVTGTDGMADETIRAMAFGEQISTLIDAWRATNPIAGSVLSMARELRDQYQQEVMTLFHAMEPWTLDSIVYHLNEIDPESQVKQELVKILDETRKVTGFLVEEMVTYQEAEANDGAAKEEGPRVLNHACINHYFKAQRQRLQVINRLHTLNKERKGGR
jgi:hypothetical protein